MFDTTEATSHSIDGGVNSIVRLGVANRAEIAGFVAGLGEAGLRARFDRHMSAAMVRSHYDAVDWTAGVVLAWMCDGGIRGVVETHLYATERGLEAESALCVCEGWQGRGIGRLLMARAVAEAAGRGAWRSVVVPGTPGCGLVRIVRRLGGTIEAGSGLGVIVH